VVVAIGGLKVMADRCIGCNCEDYVGHALPMCRMFGDL
jgi:hypothetical protein